MMGKHTKRTFACALLAALLCTAAIPSLAGEEPSAFPWLTYSMHVTLCADYQDPQTQMSAANEGDRLVQVRLAAIDEEIAFDDIEAHAVNMLFLQDSTGKDYAAGTWIVHAITFEGGQLGTTPLQPAFELIYEIPKDVPLDELTLLIGSDAVGDRIAVPLSNVPREEPDAAS